MTHRRTLLGLATLVLGSCGGGALKAGPGDGGLDGATGDAGVAAALRTELAAAWTFDVDGRDHSGHALDLQITGLHIAAGHFGKGLQLGGDKTAIAQRPVDDPTLNLATGDFTVSFWINFTKTDSAQFVAVKGFNEGGWFVGWAQTAWAFGLPAPRAGATFVPAGGSPTPGTFHHVIFERTADTAEIFVDSASVGTASAADTAAPGTAPFQVGGFAPGGVAVSTGDSVVNGVVDDLAIWHRALQPDERAYLATHAVP